MKLADQIHALSEGYDKDGNKISYSAAVYTQTTDVETEVNGIMTYDREIVKFDENRLREAANRLTSLYGAASAEVPFADGIIGKPVYYNVMGVRFDSPQPGINIVKEADGTVKKILHTTL